MVLAQETQANNPVILGSHLEGVRKARMEQPMRTSQKRDQAEKVFAAVEQ